MVPVRLVDADALRPCSERFTISGCRSRRKPAEVTVAADAERAGFSAKVRLTMNLVGDAGIRFVTYWSFYRERATFL